MFGRCKWKFLGLHSGDSLHILVRHQLYSLEDSTLFFISYTFGNSGQMSNSFVPAISTSVPRYLSSWSPHHYELSGILVSIEIATLILMYLFIQCNASNYTSQKHSYLPSCSFVCTSNINAIAGLTPTVVVCHSVCDCSHKLHGTQHTPQLETLLPTLLNI